MGGIQRYWIGMPIFLHLEIREGPELSSPQGKPALAANGSSPPDFFYFPINGHQDESRQKALFIHHRRPESLINLGMSGLGGRPFTWNR